MHFLLPLIVKVVEIRKLSLATIHQQHLPAGINRSPSIITTLTTNTFSINTPNPNPFGFSYINCNNNSKNNHENILKSTKTITKTQSCLNHFVHVKEIQEQQEKVYQFKELNQLEQPQQQYKETERQEEEVQHQYKKKVELKQQQQQQKQEQRDQNKQKYFGNHSFPANGSLNNPMLMIKSNDESAKLQTMGDDEKDEKSKDEEDSSYPGQRRDSLNSDEQLKIFSSSNESSEKVEKKLAAVNLNNNTTERSLSSSSSSSSSSSTSSTSSSSSSSSSTSVSSSASNSGQNNTEILASNTIDSKDILEDKEQPNQPSQNPASQESQQQQPQQQPQHPQHPQQQPPSSQSLQLQNPPEPQQLELPSVLFDSLSPSPSPSPSQSQQSESPDQQSSTNPSSNDLNSSSFISSSISSSGEITYNISTVDGQKSKTAKTSSQANSNSPSRKTSKAKLPKTSSFSKFIPKNDEDSLSKNSDTSGELLVRGATAQESNTSIPTNANEPKAKTTSRLSERAKKKSWYNLIYPNYKSRAEDFKKLFKEVPNDERLIVDYSCALQRDILVQGRLYVSQNYLCFHANIFSWETYLTLKWKDVTSITKDKTALVIPNAISICTGKEKYFFATFAARDKAFLMLFRVWQNTLMNKQLQPQEIWQYVHNCYGEELGLTTDDEDYIDPTTVPPIETETELEFISAVDDNSSINNLAGGTTFTITSNTTGVGATTLTTTFIGSGIGTSSSSPTATVNIGSGGGGGGDNLLNSVNATATQSISGSSTSSCSGPRKSKSKSYFFTQKRNSSTTASASASGSDNKASGDNKSSSKMKANAKEITLISAKPDEHLTTPAPSANSLQTANNDGSLEKVASGNSVNSGGTTVVISSSTSIGTPVQKEFKSSSTNTLHEVKRKSKHKTVETEPTDLSDSSDFENSSGHFVATTSCSSTHEGRQLLHTILPINIDVLFNMLFSKSKFLMDFHATRNSTDLNLGEWVESNQGQKTRIVNVTVQVAASVGPKTSRVTEEQTMRDCSKPGELYSIDVNSTNAGIPYADSFSVLMHYCLVRTVDDHTMLSVHAQIKYKKSIWAVVKGFIEKNTWAGLEDFYTSLLQNLQSETCLLPAKSKGRRTRRGTQTLIRNADDTPTSTYQHHYITERSESVAIRKSSVPFPQFGQQSDMSVMSTNYRSLSIFIVVLLGFLLAFNVILLTKLWKLEERVDYDINLRARLPNLSNMKTLPNNNQEWVRVLREQEILHEKELKKWHRVLQTAIELLKKTEKTLADLMFR